MRGQNVFADQLQRRRPPGIELVVVSQVADAADVIHQSRQFESGFSLDDENVGFSDISNIGPGGNFLLSQLTGKYYKKSQFSSSIWPFLTLDTWRKMGEPKADKILKDKTCELLGNLISPSDKNDIISNGETFLASNDLAGGKRKR